MILNYDCLDNNTFYKNDFLKLYKSIKYNTFCKNYVFLQNLVFFKK